MNLAPSVKTFAALPPLPQGVARQSYSASNEVDFRPALLGAALALALIDLVIAFALRGLLPRLGRGSAVAGATLLALVVLPAARAGDDDFAIKAASQFHLAYIRTGIPDVDDEVRAGLAGLTDILNRRTAVDAAEPMEVDVEHDDLVFFPLLYWAVTPGETPPSPQAIERLNRFLATGGTIVFDTRDQGGGGGDEDAHALLQQLAHGLDIPPLVPVPPDHVLTKSFYLMQEFPGRWSGGKLWVEPAEDVVNDGVSSVIVGGNDWAGAWAIDGSGRPLYPVVPGGEQQREMAYRFGVNLVMYALTGNYKSDQVHVPAILERLGQ